MARDWEAFESLTTAAARRRVASSHGFRTISAFRATMSDQALALARDFRDVDASDLAFAWRTWPLLSRGERRRIANEHGYGSVPNFEDFLAVQQAEAATAPGGSEHGTAPPASNAGSNER